MRNGHAFDRLNRPEIFDGTIVRHILVPTKLAHADRAALTTGLRFAAAHRAAVTVLHVVPPEPTTNPVHWLDAIDTLNRKLHGDGESARSVASPLEHAQASLQAFLDLAIPKSRRDSFDVRPVCRIGDVAEEVGRFAKEYDVDLVILGRRGTSRWFWPSLSERIERATDKPVVLVRPEVASAAPRLAAAT